MFISQEEARRWKEELVKAEEEKEKSQMKLEQARREHQMMQEEKDQWKGLANEANKRLKLEEESNSRIKRCLDAANQQLMIKSQEKNEAKAKIVVLKRSCDEFRTSERGVVRQLNDLQQQLKMVVKEYEERIQREK